MLTASSSAIVMPFPVAASATAIKGADTAVRTPVSQQPGKKYDRLAWLKQVKVDPNLRPSCFKTAFEVTQYANVLTGEFWASAKTIAEGGNVSDGIAMSEATVNEDLRKLVAAGHLEITKAGRPGRGHSTRYRLIQTPQSAKVSSRATKPQPAEVSEPGKTSASGEKNLRIGQKKPQRAEKNHRENHSSNHTEAGLRPAASVYVDRESDVTDDARERAYGALWRIYPFHPHLSDNNSEPDSREEFDKLLDQGIDPGEIIAGAADYAARCKDADPRIIDFMVCWLREKGWKDKNYGVDWL